MCRQSTKVNNCTKPFAASQNKECEEDCNAFRPIIAPLPGVCAGLCQSVHLTTNPKLQNSSVHLDLVCNLFLCMLNSKTAHFTAFLPSVNKHSGSEAANAASDQSYHWIRCDSSTLVEPAAFSGPPAFVQESEAINPTLPNPSRNYCPFSFLFEIASHPSTGSGCAAKYRRAAAAAWTEQINEKKVSHSESVWSVRLTAPCQPICGSIFTYLHAHRSDANPLLILRRCSSCSKAICGQMSHLESTKRNRSTCTASIDTNLPCSEFLYSLDQLSLLDFCDRSHDIHHPSQWPGQTNEFTFQYLFSIFQSGASGNG